LLLLSKRRKEMIQYEKERINYIKKKFQVIDSSTEIFLLIESFIYKKKGRIKRGETLNENK